MYVSRLFLGVAVLSAAFGLGCQSQSAERAFQMGEKVSVGPFLYTVFETQWLTHLGTAPDEKVPQNRFLLVRMNIVNSGSKQIAAPATSLVDDKGNEYSEITTDLGAPQWLGVLRQVPAADSLAGNVIYDVPPGHYRLRLFDDNGDKSVLVDLPLSFTSEPTEVPTPSTPKKEPLLLRK